MQDVVTFSDKQSSNSAKNWYLYIILVLSTNAIFFLFQKSLITETVYYNSFQAQLDNDRIDALFNMQAKFAWITYVFVPLWLAIKVFVISLCIQTGAVLQNVKLKFSTIISTVLVAEFVFLLPLIIKVFWFLFFKTNYTITEVQQFYPLSVLNLFDAKHLQPFLIYPFSTFNVFELMYWVILAGCIKQALNTNFDTGLKVVVSGYLPALVLWMLCIMFVTVNLSPPTA